VSSLKSAIKNDFVIHRFVKLLWLRLCRAKLLAAKDSLFYSAAKVLLNVSLGRMVLKASSSSGR